MPPLSVLGKTLMIFGGSLFLLGLLLVVGASVGLGQLPGDVSFKRGNVSVFFPIVTCILLSVGLTVVLNLVLRFFR